MEPIQRGDVRSCRTGSGGPARLIVVLARNGAIPFLPAIMVAPVTTTIRGLPSEVRVETDLGLGAPAAVNLDALTTVPHARLGKLTGRLGPEELREVCAALHIAVGCESGPSGGDSW